MSHSVQLPTFLQKDVGSFPVLGTEKGHCLPNAVNMKCVEPGETCALTIPIMRVVEMAQSQPMGHISPKMSSLFTCLHGYNCRSELQFCWWAMLMEDWRVNHLQLKFSHLAVN